jgi:hypothetical protein
VVAGHLRRMPSSPEDTAGMLGALFMAIDELFAPQHLKEWIDDDSSIGRPEVESTA